MTIADYREKYAGMSSAEVRELISDTSNAFRSETEALYVKYFRQSLNKACGDCWIDAYVLLMRTDMKKMEERAARQFELRAGAVLIAPNGDVTKMCNRNSMTDELALYHLRTHPACIELFSRYPHNWEKLVADSVDLVARQQMKEAAAAQEAQQAEKTPADDTTTTGDKKTQQRTGKGGKTGKKQ